MLKLFKLQEVLQNNFENDQNIAKKNTDKVKRTSIKTRFTKQPVD